jgi:hypothetical protein
MDLGQPIEDNDAATKKYVDDNSGTGSGEINTASNLGAGDGLYSAKVGVDLKFKSLTEGTGITLTPGANEIEIASHANTNDPSVDEKAAMAGTSGTAPDATNPFVDNADTRMSDSRTPTAHNHDGSAINAGTIDGDRLPALDAAKRGGVPATGVPSGKFLKDNGSWDVPVAAGIDGPYRVKHDDASPVTLFSTTEFCEIKIVAAKCIVADAAATLEIGFAGNTAALMSNVEMPKLLNGKKVNIFPTATIEAITPVIATIGGGGVTGEWDVWFEVVRFT